VPIPCHGAGRTASSQGAVSPNISTACNDVAEYFYSDSYESGSQLCLSSTGYVDLHIIPFGFNDNWANKISSWDNVDTFAGRGYESSSGTYGAYVPVPFRTTVDDLTDAVVNGVNYGNWNDRIQEICVDGPGVPNCSPR